MRCPRLFLLLTALRLWPTISFVPANLPTTITRCHDHFHRPKAIRIMRFASPQVSDESESVTTAAAAVSDMLQGAEIVELSLPEHRPLGCTVEESLGKKYGNVVFCTKVTPGGFAEKAGVRAGDVFLGVSGMFEELENVTTAGIDRV